MRKVDLHGHRYGRLSVVCEGRPYYNTNGRRVAAWDCICDCGNNAVVRGSDLRSGRTLSCGCVQKIRASQASKKHGESSGANRTVEYTTWASMIGRCENESNPDFHLYGGLGVKVCSEWRNSYETFLSDMGRRPPGRNSIDRINAFGDYSPNNCRWATVIEQARNKRSTIMVNIGWGDMPFSEACEINNVPYKLALRRMRILGWSIEDSVSVRANSGGKKCQSV